jgi:hypothetical protein
MSHYISEHYVPRTQKHSRKVVIIDVCDLPLRMVLYTITCMAGSVAPHMDL